MTHNSPRRIYVNIIENRITFRIKIGYYVRLLTLDTMKFLGNTKSKITKDEDGENLGITDLMMLFQEIVYLI